MTLPRSGSAASAAEPNATILLSSDWHIEPWYSGDAFQTRQPWFHGGVVRFNQPSDLNMFRCADGATGLKELPCKMDLKNDPPESHAASHLQAFQNASNHRQAASRRDARQSAPPRPSLFYIGDTQAHLMNFTEYGDKARSQCPPCEWNFSKPYHMAHAIEALMERMMALVLRTFSADDVYWTAGNHDGPEDTAFAKEATLPESLAWGKVLVAKRVVNNDLGRRYAKDAASLDDQHAAQTLSQTDFFLETGYYLKRFAALAVPSSATPLFVMVTNGAVGRSNPRHSRAMAEDLAWIDATTAGRGGVYVLGHYPQITGCSKSGNKTTCGIDTYVPPRFHHLLRGTFAGHIHSHRKTNMSNLFTQVGSVDPAGSDSFMIASVGPANDYRLVVDPAKDAYVYGGKAGELSNASAWRPA